MLGDADDREDPGSRVDGRCDDWENLGSEEK